MPPWAIRDDTFIIFCSDTFRCLSKYYSFWKYSWYDVIHCSFDVITDDDHLFIVKWWPVVEVFDILLMTGDSDAVWWYIPGMTLFPIRDDTDGCSSLKADMMLMMILLYSVDAICILISVFVDVLLKLCSDIVYCG